MKIIGTAKTTSKTTSKIEPWKKEWSNIVKKERLHINKAKNKNPNFISQQLEDKVPEKLQDQLDKAFAKSFQLIFEKGTGVLEKTYNKDKLEFNHKINNLSIDIKDQEKGLDTFSQNAKQTNAQNVILSGAKGVSLGVFGIGLPDIPIFLGLMLKSIYEISLQYGYDYDKAKERYFILSIIEAALTGEDVEGKNEAINKFIITNKTPANYSQELKISQTSNTLSTELLCVKFLQGLPLVGAVGGIFDALFTNQILKYAQMKYHRRFLFDKYIRPQL